MKYDNTKFTEAETPETTEPTTEEAMPNTQTGFRPYKVRVTIENLLVRKSPNGEPMTTGSISNKKMVTTGSGIFEISKEQDGFGYIGRLKGWVKLDYTEKV